MSNVGKKAYKPKSNTKEIPQWAMIEKIAALLEKILTPLSRVEHNVRLPVLGRDRKRQCDVVITSGEAPRQIKTIVEVQKRKSKPSITTFHGWCEKMREVGAQQLICVSSLGYPNSIIEEVALKYGPTVKLLTLKELEETKINNLILPLNFIINQTPTFSIEALGKIKLENPPANSELNFSSTDQVFEVEGDSKRIDINELISRTLNKLSASIDKNNVSELKTYKIELTLGSDEKVLWLYVGEHKYKIFKLPVTVNIKHIKSTIPITHFEYKHEEIADATAWVVAAKGKDASGKEVSFELIFKPDKNGLLQLFSSKSLRGINMYIYSSKLDLLNTFK